VGRTTVAGRWRNSADGETVGRKPCILIGLPHSLTRRRGGAIVTGGLPRLPFPGKGEAGKVSSGAVAPRALTLQR
jgi:hypothetical protein